MFTFPLKLHIEYYISCNEKEIIIYINTHKI